MPCASHASANTTHDGVAVAEEPSRFATHTASTSREDFKWYDKYFPSTCVGLLRSLGIQGLKTTKVIQTRYDIHLFILMYTYTGPPWRYHQELRHFPSSSILFRMNFVKCTFISISSRLNVAVVSVLAVKCCHRRRWFISESTRPSIASAVPDLRTLVSEKLPDSPKSTWCTMSQLARIATSGRGGNSKRGSAARPTPDLTTQSHPVPRTVSE